MGKNNRKRRTEDESSSSSGSSTDDMSSEESAHQRRRQKARRSTRKKGEIINKLTELEETVNECKNGISEIRKLLEINLCNLPLRTNGTNNGDDSTVPRSQSNQVQPRYRLILRSEAIDKIEKGQIIDITVVLVDCNNNDQTVETGPLASATVELVVVNAEFNKHDNQFNWSREDFKSNIKKPKKTRQGNSATGDVDQSLKSIVSNGRFNLCHGAKCHSGSTIFSNSGNKKVRLAVMVVSPTEERVLEGLSNPFFVRGHDRPNRHKLHDNRRLKRHRVYQEQNGPKPNMLNPSWPNSTQGLDITGQPQLPFEGNTAIPSTQPSTSQRQQDSMQKNQGPNWQTFPQSVNNRTDVYHGYQEQNCPVTNMQNLSRPNSTQAEGIRLDTIGQPQLQFAGNTAIPSTEPSTIQGQEASIQQIFTQLTNYHTGVYDGQGQYGPTANMRNSLWPNSTQGSDIIGQPQLPFRGNIAIPCTEQSTSQEQQALIPQNQGSHWQNLTQPTNNRTGTQLNTNQIAFPVHLLWDRPNVEPNKHRWNLLDELMPLYSCQSKLNNCGLPTVRLMPEHLGSLTIMPKEVMQTRRRGGVLIELLEPDESDEERRLKRKMCSKCRLRFVNRVCEAYYKMDPIKADDGNLLKVALFDENNRKITSGPLSSASVEIVVLHGDFNKHGQDYWTSEEFTRSVVCPRPGEEASSVLGGDRILVLADGEACLGDAFFQVTSLVTRTGKFKMGVVMLASAPEERIQPGISEPFQVMDRPLAGQALVDDGYQEQNGRGPMPNLRNPSWPNSTQAGGITLKITGGQQQLPLLGNTAILSTESSISYEEQALIERHQVPHRSMLVQATNNQTGMQFDTNQIALPLHVVWDRPNVERPSKRCWNLVDQLMPLYSCRTKSNDCGLPTMRLMTEHLGSLTSIPKEVMQTCRKRGVLVEPLPNDSYQDNILQATTKAETAQ